MPLFTLTTGLITSAFFTVYCCISRCKDDDDDGARGRPYLASTPRYGSITIQPTYQPPPSHGPSYPRDFDSRTYGSVSYSSHISPLARQVPPRHHSVAQVVTVVLSYCSSPHRLTSALSPLLPVICRRPPDPADPGPSSMPRDLHSLTCPMSCLTRARSSGEPLPQRNSGKGRNARSTRRGRRGSGRSARV